MSVRLVTGSKNIFWDLDEKEQGVRLLKCMNHFVKEFPLMASLPLGLRSLLVGACAEEAERPVLLPSPLPVWSDEQLVERLASGGPDALSLIYDRYAGSLYRLLNALLGSPVDAEDALQEVFVTLATGRVSRIRNLKSYLFVAARHQAFTVLRRRKREPQFEDVTELEIAAPDGGSAGGEPDWAVLLARLPLEQREVIALKVWEQMTFADIAQVVRASPNTVMSRYRYGIERLRQWCREDDLD